MALHSALFFYFQKEEFLQWQKKDLSKVELADFNEQISQMPDFAYTPWFQAIIMFLTIFFIGAIVNLISALILKKGTTISS